jgi:hypothetical protein
VENQEASRIICGGEINEDSIITSPGFDNPDRGYYYNNLNCIWELDFPFLLFFDSIFNPGIVLSMHAVKSGQVFSDL